MAHDPPLVTTIQRTLVTRVARLAPFVATLGLISMFALVFVSGVGAPDMTSHHITAAAAAANVPPIPGDNPVAVPSGVAAIIHVPADFATIQAAVDRAVPGQIILIAPGIYHEGVRIRTPHLTLRGADRTGVILDGRQGNGHFLGDGVYVGPGGDDVIVENMTARYYVGNGFYWNGVTGYRGSYLTAYNNGDYGIYAFGATRGQFDHVYAAGSPDSGIYIGQCFPCDALVTDSVSEYNALGYSGTNAGGNLVLRDSVWRYNGTGIVPNTLDSEKNPPQQQTTIVHNLVYANNNTAVPFKNLEYPPFGIGIALPGGIDNLVMDNTIEGQDNYGILVLPNIDKNFWIAHGDTVINNTITGSGIGDLGLALPAGPNNCFSGNHVSTTHPFLLQQTHGCGTLGSRSTGGDPGPAFRLITRFVGVGGFKDLAGIDYGGWSQAKADALQNRWQTFREPGAQPNMPGDLSAPVRPIFTESWTSGTIAVADPHATSSTKAVAAVGFSSLIEILVGFYSYLLPIALFAAWLGIGLWDLARRDELSAASRYGWMAAIIGIPLLGSIGYYVLGKSTLTRGFRWMMVGGGLAIWLGGTILLLILASNIS